MSDSLWPHELQHTRPPFPSPTPRFYSNSCPLCRWCHPTISSSVIPFFSHLQSFPVSASFQIRQFFASGGQSIGISACPSNEYSRLISFRMDWLDLLAVQGTLKSLLKGSLQPYGILLSKRVFVTLGSLQPYGLSPTRLLCPWNSPGKHTGGGCYALLQWTFGPRHQTHDSYISCIGRQVI